MADLLNYLVHNLWWPVPAAVAAGAVGAGIGHLATRGRRT